MSSKKAQQNHQNVLVVFIISEKYEDESQTSQLMQDVYKECKQNLMDANWALETESDSVDLNKTTLIVFEEFAGEFYNKAIQSKSVRILGPLCLLTCLSKQIPIPNVDWPIFTMAMYGCIVACSNLLKPEKEEIKNRIEKMGGTFTPMLTMTNTHLITNTVRSEKYYQAAPRGLKILKPSWVDDVWTASQKEIVHADDDRFNIHKCKTFHNLIVCSTGFDLKERDTLEKAITENGGQFFSQMNINTTDILVCNGSNSSKYKRARQKKIPCVYAGWVFDSIKVGYSIPEVIKYSVKKETSTPTKSDGINPNFSTMSAITNSTSQTLQHSVLQETINCSSVPNVTRNLTPFKRKNPFKENEIVDCIDIKKAKKSGAFLDGCSIYLTGFNSEHTEKLCKLLNFSGATRYDTLCERISHIVVGDPKNHELKLIRAKKGQWHLVSIKWLIDSMEKGHAVAEEEYLLSATSSSSDHGSPLVKKGLRLLRADVSVLDTEPNLAQPTTTHIESEEKDDDADILKQYLKPTDSQDSLAALLAANNFNSEFSPPPQQPAQQKNCTEQQSLSSQSISVSMDANETCVVFSGKTFIVLNFSEEETKNIVLVIEEMGGQVLSSNTKVTVDYAVIPIVHDNLNLNARLLVNDLWLTECYDQRLIIDYKYYHKPCKIENDKTLENLVISVNGFQMIEKNYLKIVCEGLGAIVQNSLARIGSVEKNILASTHLISVEGSGKKFEAAVKWGLPVITKDWVLECLKEGKYVEEDAFLIGKSKENISKLKSIVNNKTMASTSKNVTSTSINVASTPKNVTATAKDDTTLKNMATTSDNITSTPKNLARTSKNLVSMASSATNMTVTPKNNNLNNITPSSGNGTPKKNNTPLAHQLLRNRLFSDTPTPPNLNSPVCSQITPVNQIMKDVRDCLGVNLPPTPLPWDYIKTPTSPLGAFICDNPSPGLRKSMARWIEKFPDTKPHQRRLSTPLSELKRRLWEQIYPTNQENCRMRQPNFDEADTETDQALNEVNIGQNSSEDTPEKMLIGEKLQELQDVLASSTNSSRRSSLRKVDPVVCDECHDKESQPFSVGWDENMDCDSMKTEQYKSKPALFMISAVEHDDRDKLIENIEKLGKAVSSLQNYDPSSTHLIMQKLNRNEKLLASVAAGKWVLHTSYITDSIKANRFLDESEYEYGNPKAKFKVEGKEAEDRARCAHYWRKEISRRGYGAFHDMRAIVVAGRREPIIRVIEAGGGMVIDAKPPFDENLFATHCLMEIKCVPVQEYQHYIPLARKGVFCVNTIYVNDFLHRNVKDIRDYIIPSFINFY